MICVTNLNVDPFDFEPGSRKSVIFENVCLYAAECLTNATGITGMFLSPGH